MSTTITVELYVPQEIAIRRGSTTHGKQRLELTEADLGQLTPEEREELARTETTSEGVLNLHDARNKNGHILSIHSEEYTLSAVRAALARHVEIRRERDAAEAEEKAKREEIERQVIARVLTMSHRELLWEEHRRGSLQFGSMVTAPRSRLEYNNAPLGGEEIPWNAPELSALRKQLAAEAEALNATAEREEQERKAKAEAKARAEEAAAEKVKAEAEIQFRAFALDGLAGPAAQRAARDEYDVKAAVLDAIQEQLPKPSATSRPSDDYEWGERTSPRKDAFELLDRITEATKAVTRKPACASVEVSRIMRITEPDEEETGEKGTKHTGVVVTISSPITTDRHLLYYTE